MLSSNEEAEEEEEGSGRRRCVLARGRVCIKLADVFHFYHVTPLSTLCQTLDAITSTTIHSTSSLAAKDT